jgi:hypothetical protein
MVPAATWLAEPVSVRRIRSASSAPRTYTPHHDILHRWTFSQARGWRDVGPYFDLRELLQPNLGGGYWATPSADCYSGIAPRWYVDLWGDHNRPGLLTTLTTLDPARRVLDAHSSLPNLLSASGVTHLLTPFPLQGAFLGRLDQHEPYVYATDDPQRVRVLPHAVRVSGVAEVSQRLREGVVDLTREVMLHDVPADVTLPSMAEGDRSIFDARARIVSESSSNLRVDVSMRGPGYLLIADTFHPGWTATVNGAPVSIYRANIASRAIVLSGGSHTVDLHFEAPAFYRGLAATGIGLTALLTWVITSMRRARAEVRRDSGSSVERE